MTTEATPEVLREILQDIQPISDSTMKTYRQLDGPIMAAEEGRLLERFLDIAAKLVAINHIKEQP